MATRTGRDGDTRSQILDVAERLVQRRGFNGFSYADVAEELQITKPALHYHFAGWSGSGCTPTGTPAIVLKNLTTTCNAAFAIDTFSATVAITLPHTSITVAFALATAVAALTQAAILGGEVVGSRP